MSWLSFSYYSNAQDLLTTPNVVGNQWSNTVPATPGGTRGGNVPGYNAETNTILFGYTQQTVNQRIVLNNILEGTGIKIHGYNYSFDYINSGFSRGSLAGSFILLDKDNKAIDSMSLSLGSTEGWKTVAGTRNFTNQYGLDYAKTLSLNFTGKDDRFWAGYYGPQIRSVNVSFRYAQDLCATNPLSSPSCDGYEKAYFDQQCKASVFYSIACPGYEQAFFTQQCTANPLYNSNCPGYQQAFLAQQCSLNTLYNPSCPGYAKALFDKTCNENPLSSDSCPLYQAAYLDQQCKANPLFSAACPMYQQAFFNQQCTANPLYNSGCLGYAEAFRKKQFTDACNANSQSSPQCPNYKIEQQVTTMVRSVTPQSVVSIGNEDPVKLLTKPQITDNPFVNQLIQAPEVKSERQGTEPMPQSSRQMSQQEQGQRRERTQTSTPEQRRAEAARRAISPNAQSNSQTAQQDAQIASMGVTPGFSAYEQAKLPDVPFYRSEDIYKRATINDNARALRQLNQRSDRIHKEMVDEQYRR